MRRGKRHLLFGRKRKPLRGLELNSLLRKPKNPCPWGGVADTTSAVSEKCWMGGKKDEKSDIFEESASHHLLTKIPGLELIENTIGNSSTYPKKVPEKKKTHRKVLFNEESRKWAEFQVCSGAASERGIARTGSCIKGKRGVKM